MIEAELKARVRDVEAVQRWLRERATEEPATYHDTYYDWPDHSLDTEGREIRLRTVTTPEDTNHLLTYKQPPVDQESGSKPEHEATVTDPTAIDTMLRDLGMIKLVSLTKHCENFRFAFEARPIIATLVTVPELDGTYIEVETSTELGQVESALATVRVIMTNIGVINDLDPSSYTGEVVKYRGERSSW